MKRIDYLLIKSFIPPFILAFLIALFVLVMQTLFIYMDEFIGKNLGLFVVTELIFWLSISLFPMALAIGVLLASVLVFGNMGEKYELSSFKSAGISLFRIMGALIVFVTFISLFSYFCSDYLNPKAKLQFHSRMWDIRRQKPTLSIDERIFNNDFFGFSIWIDSKLPDGEDIDGVLVYNQKENSSNIDVISAKDGKMYTNESGRYFMMKLNDGVKYTEEFKESKGGKLTYPFIRTEFKSWKKAFDLNEFELESTDQELFKSHQYMRTTRELIMDIDSFEINREELASPLGNRFHRLLNIEVISEVDEEMRAKHITEIPEDILKDSTSTIENKDSLLKDPLSDNQPSIDIEMLDGMKPLGNNPEVLAQQSVKEGTPGITRSDIEPFHETAFFDSSEVRSIYATATTSVKNLQYEILKAKSEQKRLDIKLAKFQFELHSKFSLAVACFIFLFIGAPMGAIVRKGGFGYPLLISIVFFAIYVIATIAMKKMAETLKIDAILGAWLPTLIIFAFGIFLTIKAKNDSKVMDLDILVAKIVKFFRKLFAKNQLT